ncbi:unnamed protein product [Caenorhabditis angaria]|uniref:Phospholipase A(2) n=1 Tax=Caenorhabditis angaria TaxID=860376 RepID=A0A9P1NC28_9PELO|nr:unnamed protein product [Caenorhabditis angaria]
MKNILTKFIFVIVCLISISTQDVLIRNIDSSEDNNYSNSDESDREARLIPSRHWFCGSGRWSHLSSYFVIGGCFGAKYDFNHQCAIHDDCYDNQRGKEKCDAAFCEKNKVIASNYYLPNCYAYSKLSCIAVKTFGGDAYASAGNSHSYYEPYVMNNDFGTTYKHIFDNCKHQNATFSDCAFIYETCLDKTWGNCGRNLKGCILETKDQRDPDTVCDAAVEKVAQQIAE